MDWTVFSYSLPAKSSSPRVATWRQLQRLGAISVAGGAYVLPAIEECEEAFRWLAQKVRHADGEALVMRVANFGDVTEQQIVALFNQARREDYATVDAQVDALEVTLRQHAGDLEGSHDEIGRLRQAEAAVARIDYFGCPEGALLVSRLERIRASFFPDGSAAMEIPRASLEAYAGKVWVTRPHPHVDRLARFEVADVVAPLAAVQPARPRLEDIRSVAGWRRVQAQMRACLPGRNRRESEQERQAPESHGNILT